MSSILFFGTITSLAEWTPSPDDELKVKFAIITPRYSFDVKAPPAVSKSVVKLAPHSLSQTGVGLSYRNLGLRLATSNPTSSDENKIYGSTKATDFQLRFFGTRSYEFFYQKYKGYYIENTNNFDPLKIYSKNKIIRDDIETLNTGMNLYWDIHHSRFSQSVAFDQNGHQLDNNWGASWVLCLNNYQIKADEAIVPSGYANDFGAVGNLNRINTASLTLGGSLGGILTYENFYIASLFALGVGYQNSRLNFIDAKSDSVTNTGTYSSLRAGFGYNGKKHVAGIQALLDSVSTPYKKAEVVTTSTLFSFFYAYRFGDINIPAANWLSDKIKN